MLKHLALCLALALPASAARIPAHDALADAPSHPRRAFSPAPFLGTLVDSELGAHVDTRLGLPTFLWAARQGPSAALRTQAASRLTHEQAARLHLTEYAELWSLSPAAARAATLRELHDTGTGALIARFTQSVAGIPVFRSELNVAMDRAHQLIAVSGFLSPDLDPAAPAPDFPLDFRDAAARALADLHGGAPAPGDWGEPSLGHDGYHRAALSPAAQERLGLRFSRPLRTRRVLFQLQEGLVPAHYVELWVESAESSAVRERFAVSYVVSAVDGRLLLRHDLESSDYTYRVWADPATKLPAPSPQGKGWIPYPKTGPDGTEPPFVAPVLLTLANFPYSKNDPWLPANATSTTGNNVDAYADLVTPDGFSDGDLRAAPTAPGVFDRTYDPTKDAKVSVDQQKAVITQLFYMNNFLHDWYYDFGFDEKARNGQASNFGRGGAEGDPLHAEAQDYSGVYNANMSTPPDGASGRMQMYLFPTPGPFDVSVLEPASLAGPVAFGGAQFGPQAFDVTGVLAATIPNDACGSVNNDMTGRIALIDRGTCTFVEKTLNAQAAGAIGVVVVNNVVATGGFSMGGIEPAINIPAVFLQQAQGNPIKAATSPVKMHLKNTPGPARDGGLDQGIVAHEWGHFISNRLIGDAGGLINHMGRGLGEGWADFHAMLFQVRAGDVTVSGNDHWQGIYAMGPYATFGLSKNAAYFGIRRYPYSTDMTKNPLTFKYIQDGVPLPQGPGAPVFEEVFATPDGSQNSEVHATGEIWGSMLWECYSSLLRDTLGGSPRLTFDQARDRMKGYLVAAYKLTPAAPTLLEARDAVLAAALAGDVADYGLFVKAFAKRGAGSRAASPDRYSADNKGVIESFEGGADVKLESFSLDDTVTPLCGGDGLLQAGETGKLAVTVRNIGSTALASLTGVVSTSNTQLTFPAGATLNFGPVAPHAAATASVNVALAAGTTGAQTVALQLTLNDANMTAPLVTTLGRRVNVDEVAYQSATDDVESVVSTWTLSHSTTTDATADGLTKWRRVEVAPDDHRWMAIDVGVRDVADVSLVSPPLVLGAGASKLSFTHRYNLSTYVFTAGKPAQPVTLGVVEISSDSGTTWTDVGLTYPGRMGNAAGQGIPEAGRPGYVALSPGWPARATVSVTLDPKYAGQTVLLRFRLVVFGVGATGWEVDDIKLEGLSNLPFAKVGPHTATCVPPAPTAKATAPQAAQEGAAVQLDGSGSSNAAGQTGALTYSWYQLSGPPALLSSHTDPKPTFTPRGLRKNETIAFGLQVSSGGATSAPASTSTVVTHVPKAPVADAGAAQTVPELTAVILDGSASSDPYGQTLSYTWTQTAGTSVKLTTDDAHPKATFTVPIGAAPMTFQLVVGNGELSSPPATVVVNVTKSGGGCGGGGAGSVLQLLPVAFLLAGLGRRRR